MDVFSFKDERLSGIKHGFFGRTGGVSSGDFASLNCGLRPTDNIDSVIENRRRAVCRINGHDANLYTCFQIHSVDVLSLTDTSIDSLTVRGDSIVTNIPGIFVAVTTADCAPILLADAKNKVVASAHAGWRGAINGIVENTISQMEDMGSERSEIVAMIGPCISQKNYEVGEDFKEKLFSINTSNLEFFREYDNSTKSHFSLFAYIQSKLALEKIETVSIDICTFSNSDKFFSARRSKKMGMRGFGEQLSMIGITC